MVRFGALRFGAETLDRGHLKSFDDGHGCSVSSVVMAQRPYFYVSSH